MSERYKVCGVELMRCRSDGRLMTDYLCSIGLCAGHYLIQPARPSLFELLLLKAGIYNQVKLRWWGFMEWLSR